MGSQQATLKEKQKANANLLRRVDTLFAEKREADKRLVKLQTDLDREMVAQRNQEGELDQLWKKFKAMELVSRKNCPRLGRS